MRYVITQTSGQGETRFYTDHGRNSWVSEYPDATKFATARSAAALVAILEHQGYRVRLVEDYGLNSERVVHATEG
jgi:hypothetical protein